VGRLRYVVATAAVGVAGLAGGVVAIAQGGRGAADQGPRIGSGTLPEGSYLPYPLAPSAGLDPAEAVPVFTTRTGKAVAVLVGPSVTCLVFSDETDSCAPPEQVALGHSVHVENDCSSSGSHAMNITGLVPSGVRAVRLHYSNGRAIDSAVSHGAFMFDGTTPGRGDPYPEQIDWLNGSGAVLDDHAFPIGPDGFCPGQ
jgi:hypothetical protein